MQVDTYFRANPFREMRLGVANIAVLIPCYNEEMTIGDVVHSYKALLPSSAVYVYDNNSTDDSVRVAEAAGAIVIPEYHQGKGFVVRSMFRTVDADAYLMVDGDDTYNPEDTVALLEDVLTGRADMVVGDRLSAGYFQENSRLGHGAGNRLVKWLINAIFSSNISDVMTGARAFSRPFVKTYPSLEGGFQIETEMTIHALDKNFLITQKPVRYSDRRSGSFSKLNTYRDGLRVLKTIAALFKDFRPLLFFGIATLALSMASVVAFAIPLAEFLETGLVTKFPTLIVAMALAVSALLSISCGVILDSIRKQTRTFFEIELTRVTQESGCRNYGN